MYTESIRTVTLYRECEPSQHTHPPCTDMYLVVWSIKISGFCTSSSYMLYITVVNVHARAYNSKNVTDGAVNIEYLWCTSGQLRQERDNMCSCMYVYMYIPLYIYIYTCPPTCKSSIVLTYGQVGNILT